MKIKCIIIDNEKPAIEVIQKHLLEFPIMELVGVFSNPLKALNTIEKNNIDVIFLEINLPIINGLEFIKSIGSKSQFVITTSYSEYAVDGFELNVLDFLIKPISLTRLNKTVKKLSEKSCFEKKYDNGSNENKFIFLKVGKKQIKVNFENILYIESLKQYIAVHTCFGDYIISKTLNCMAEEIPKNRFLRIHRSLIISLEKIKAIEGNSIQINDKRFSIGSKYLNHVRGVLFGDRIIN